jgi:invasion protein IalB
MYYKTTILLITYRTGDQKRGVSLKISGKQPAKVRFKRVKQKRCPSFARITDFGCYAAIQAFKGLSEKLKCQTWVLTLVMRWKDQSAHFKGLDLQVAEIKDQKQSTA